MERRTFLKSGITAAVGVGGFRSILLHASDKELNEASALNSYDLIVCGGTVSGCLSAIHAAQKGLNVLVIEERSYLGAEISAKFRPWLQHDGYEELSLELKNLILPKNEESELGIAIRSYEDSQVFFGEIPLFCGSVKKQFMAALMENKVDVLLMTGCWGIVGDKRRQVASGVVLANKFGLQIVEGTNILDARIPKNGSTEKHSFVLEFFGLEDDVNQNINVPDNLGIHDNTIRLHKGKRMPGQYFVEFIFSAKNSEAEDQARVLTEKLGTYLIAHVNAFSNASLVHMAYETIQQGPFPSIKNEQSFNNVKCLASKRSFISSCRDLIEMDVLAKQMLEGLDLSGNQDDGKHFIYASNGKIPIRECQISPIEDVGLHHAIQNIRFSAEAYIPVKFKTDLIVAGGGTAGAMVSKAALERSVNVVTIEYFSDLGGTKTHGGVIGYYWGYDEAASFIQTQHEISVLQNKLGKRSSIPAYMIYLRKNAVQKNGTLLTNSIVCDTIMDVNSITGLLVFQEGDLHIIKSSLTVDATGDGDVAVFAGASFDYGDQQMNCTQNFSQWDFKTGLSPWADSTDSRDYDIIQSNLLSEVQRGYQLAHDQAKNYDFSSMLTVRESRRIHGEYTITLKDIVEDRHYKDVISVAKSDFDPHHFGDNIYTRLGCLVPHGFDALVEIPYRSLIPKGLDNLLVSAKAISQSQTALQFTRMSMDVLNLGYATGIVAASIIQAGAGTRDIDISTIQEELKSLNIIPSYRMELPPEIQYSEKRLNQQIIDLKEGKQNSLFKILFTPKEKMLPLLKKSFHQEIDNIKKTNIARAMAWFACNDGNSLIVNEMELLLSKEIADNFLPKEYYRVDKESDYWDINRDIILLALSKDQTALLDILAVAEKMKLGNPPVQHERAYERGRIDLALVPFYNRILNICYAIELIPDEAAKTQLNRFLDDLYLRNNQTVDDPLAAGENLYGAILETRIAAALALCNEKRGFQILIAYLADVHSMIAFYAHSILCELSNNDFGFNQEKWQIYIN